MSTLAPSSFAHIDTWVFDLDNTLYPARSNLFAQIDRRMSAFIADFLGVDETEARRVQKDYYVEHGTTLSGLMKVHGINPDDFLSYVHEIDISHIDPDTALDAALGQLKGRKVIFTNGSKTHAVNVTRQLGIADHFDAMIDIAAVRYVPKPDRRAYDYFLEASDVDPRRAAMFEDIARNLLAPHALGMTTVWVRPYLVEPAGLVEQSGEPSAERHQQLSHEGADGAHVHHVTDDLTAFLSGL